MDHRIPRVIGIACAGLGLGMIEGGELLAERRRGGTGKRVGTRFPAQDPFISWTGAGPPGVGSVFNLFPLYRLPLEPGLDGSCAMANDEKANTAARAMTDRATADRVMSSRSGRASALRISLVPRHLSVLLFVLVA